MLTWPLRAVTLNHLRTCFHGESFTIDLSWSKNVRRDVAKTRLRLLLSCESDFEPSRTIILSRVTVGFAAVTVYITLLCGTIDTEFYL